MNSKKNPEQNLKKIGNKVKELRVRAGYSSYEKFAVENGFSRRYYWSVEQGRNISMEYFFRVLEALKTSPEEFFRDWE